MLHVSFCQQICLATRKPEQRNPDQVITNILFENAGATQGGITFRQHHCVAARRWTQPDGLTSWDQRDRRRGLVGALNRAIS